jgi:hypothetical protein
MDIKIMQADQVERNGYAMFNGNDHLCVDVPDGNFTITARTSEGKRVTFAFLCYENDKPPKCVDVTYHDNGTTRTNGDKVLPTFDVISFGKGGRFLYDSRKEQPDGDQKPGIVTLLMDDKN